MNAAEEAREALLTVDRLSVFSGNGSERQVIVDEVGFELAQGESLGVVGESGSGKSLSMRAIVGLLPRGLSSEGRILFDGAELIGSGAAIKRVRGGRISLLLQDPFTMLNPLQTIGVTITESLRYSGSADTGTRSPRLAKSHRTAEVGRRLQEVGLGPETADRYPHQLSGGMRQRVALAAALAKDPDLLIADEPTTALDATTQAEMLALIKRIQHQRGMSLILVTHDLRVAFSVCDRVQVMYAGSIVERGGAAALSMSPSHPYTAGLLASEPPVDRFVERLANIPGTVPRAHAVRSVCGFADRCAWVGPECRAEKPALREQEVSHETACLRIGEIRAELGAAVEQHLSPGSALMPEASAPMLATLESVRKTHASRGVWGRRRTTVVLNGVDLQIREGESLGLVGETGSGKTTIARSLLGLETIDSGRIVLDGIDCSDFSAVPGEQLRRVRRTVQAVFQDPYASLNPSLSIGSALREAVQLRGAGGGASDAVAGTAADLPGEGAAALGAAVAELLERVGLPADYALRMPADLSGGERQRVAIARAIALRPRLLLCDEPVAALDLSAQAQVLELLREVRRSSGMSMLFITHDLSVVRQMTERIVVLYKGTIVEEGSTVQVLDDPQHEYTRRLIAAVPRREGKAA